jgi:citrate synthase
MSTLKQKFADVALPFAADAKSFIKANADVVIDQVKVSQVYGGMRGVKSLITETSQLDAFEGIRFRGYSIPQLKELLPTAPGGEEPLPEGLFYLMLVNELPSEDDVRAVTDEWSKRSEVPQHVFDVLEAFPTNTHPMTQLATAILSLQPQSNFAEQYRNGIHKSQYWDPMFEDCMNLIAKLPRIAAYIYRRTFHNGDHIAPDATLDWAGNFAHMMGVKDPEFKELMRLYLTIHADHEGGNASAHTTHLVGSTLSDAYYCLASGMSALAGPLHGLANQEVIRWVLDMCEEIGTNDPSEEQIADYVTKTMQDGKVVPGYGHAVLRVPDPRFVAQKKFCEKHFPDDTLVNVIWRIFKVVPELLPSLKKSIKSPWPNVDAHSGATLMHYGVDQYDFYTVLFGVSRALGVLSSLCWSRALGLAIERPKSLTMDTLKKLVAEKIATAN